MSDSNYNTADGSQAELKPANDANDDAKTEQAQLHNLTPSQL